MYEFIKRAFDIISSGVALILLFPVWIITMAGIWISDPGTVFYVANRVGRGGVPFKMLKFRSMRVDKNADEKNFKADTNRIFRFGAFIRATKIDELPQLCNVFIGQMSVIGPRPAAVDQAEITRAAQYAEVSRLKPGLSGPSALYDYIYGDTIEDEAEYQAKVLPTRLDLDVYYTRVRSFGYDAKMIWYTVLCILYSFFRKTPQRMLSELTANAQTVRAKKD